MSSSIRQPNRAADPARRNATATVRLVGDAIQRYVESLRSSIPADSTTSLHRLFSAPGRPRVNYDELAAAFAYRYLAENYWKAVGYFLNAPTVPYDTVCDLGAGSGAASLAYIACLDDATDLECHVNLLLVDRSDAQLRIACNLLESVQPVLQRVRIAWAIKQVDLSEWTPDQNSASLVLLSHVLTENIVNASSILDSALSTARPGGRLVVIEREDDSVWHHVRHFACESFLPWESSVVGLSTAATMKVVRVRHKPSVVTATLALLVPFDKRLPEVLNAYFTAWRTKAVSLLDSVFDKDATYQLQPFRQPLCGLAAIRAYWEQEVLPQENLSLTLRSVAYSDSRILLEWHATFDVGGKRVALEGMMVLEVDRQTYRVTALRECYKTVKTPR